MFPILIGQLTRAQMILIDPADRTQYAQTQLLRTHFHRKYRDRQALLNRNVLGNIHRKRSFTHRRTTRNNHQITFLQPRRHFIQRRKARRHAGHIIHMLALVQLIDHFQHIFEHHRQLDKLIVTALAILRHLQNRLLRRINDLIRVTSLRTKRRLGNIVRRRNQFAQQTAVTNDLRIATNIHRRRHTGRQCIQIRHAADIIQPPLVLQRLKHRQHIRRMRFLNQPHDRFKYQPVVITIKIILMHHIADFIPCHIVQHQATQYRLLRLNRMRRRTQQRQIIARKIIHIPIHSIRSAHPFLELSSPKINDAIADQQTELYLLRRTRVQSKNLKFSVFT